MCEAAKACYLESLRLFCGYIASEGVRFLPLGGNLLFGEAIHANCDP